MYDLTAAIFPLHASGYVQDWLVAGPRSTPYSGTIKNDDSFRNESINRARVAPPKSAELHVAAPFGQFWRLHDAGRNFFVEYSGFWSAPALVDLYAFTEIIAEQDGEVGAYLWVAGTADLWVNDEHVTQFHVPRYMHPEFQRLRLALRRGTNRLSVRLQVAAIRDTRFLFGIQFLGGPSLTVRVPGVLSSADSLRWLDGVKTDGRDAVVSEWPASTSAEVIFSDGSSLPWPVGQNRISFGPDQPFQFDVRLTCDEQTWTRHFEIPANRNGLPGGRPDDIRRAHLDYIASTPGSVFVPGVFYSSLPLLVRRLLGRSSPFDAPSFATMIQYIRERRDCSDFALAMLLRLVQLGLATTEETSAIRLTALNFRYWDDEPGADAMCFRSENHSLLFHGCQVMAGRMYPDDVFSNSGRPGREQIALGLQRTCAWIDRAESQGLSEFLSSTYMPLTVGALLNVIDFSDDSDLAHRASRLVDRLYEDLADHAFQGLTVGPQGRVYRNVLYPEEGGTQVLLSWATPEALPDFVLRDLKDRDRTGDWIAFLATSKNYQPPEDLAEKMRRPVSRRYPQADVEIVLHKTADYILTSLAIPRSDGNPGLRPGRMGYQEHLWQATLGPGCHVFVNHPGCSLDGDKMSRPGYWYGNGVIPVVRQREEVLQTIFHIPDGTKSALQLLDLHPIPFTHAHWPSDAFERQSFQGQWLFGRKQGGYIGLWCSERLEPHDEMLTGRELRAPGCRVAWTVICGGNSQGDSFETFMESCVARTPTFDPDKLILRMNGEEPLHWPDPDVRS